MSTEMSTEMMMSTGMRTERVTFFDERIHLSLPKKFQQATTAGLSLALVVLSIDDGGSQHGQDLSLAESLVHELHTNWL